MVSIHLNTYLTLWEDKAFNFSYFDPALFQLYQFNIYGAKAIHRGIEGEASLNFGSNIILNLTTSLSFNKWLNDVKGYGHHEALPGVDLPIEAKISDLYVGSIPVFKSFLAIEYSYYFNEFIKLFLIPKILYNGFSYPQLNINDRSDNNLVKVPQEKTPDYYIADLNIGLQCEQSHNMISMFKVSLNIYNVFNKKYIISSFENITDLSSANSIWYGRERWLDLSFEVGF